MGGVVMIAAAPQQGRLGVVELQVKAKWMDVGIMSGNWNESWGGPPRQEEGKQVHVHRLGLAEEI